jgi:hypothetical protein
VAEELRGQIPESLSWSGRRDSNSRPLEPHSETIRHKSLELERFSSVRIWWKQGGSGRTPAAARPSGFIHVPSRAPGYVRRRPVGEAAGPGARRRCPSGNVPQLTAGAWLLGLPVPAEMSRKFVTRDSSARSQECDSRIHSKSLVVLERGKVDVRGVHQCSVRRGNVDTLNTRPKRLAATSWAALNVAHRK